VSAIQLDRPGIFKARPFDWSVQPSPHTKAVAISVGLLIIAQYDNGEWVSWEECEPHQTRGWWYVVGKTGAINTVAVEQLAKSLGWNGDLKAISGDAPDVVVQVSVKAEEYNGKTQYKAGWMNPENFVPESSGASDEDVSKLSVQFGSLLRAAAAGAKPKTVPAKPVAKAAPKAKAVPGRITQPGAVLTAIDDGVDDDVPF
jgi:hypothetical protein